MGRKKSGQSGAVPQTRNVGFDDKTKGVGGGDLVDTPENRAKLQELEDMLKAGMKLPGEEQAEGDGERVGPGRGQVPLRGQDYGRDRWTKGESRLPSQSEWEDIFGPKVS